MKLKATLVFLLSLFSLSFYQVQAQCDGATYVENNGIAVIEAEHANLPSNWKKETSKTPFTGNSYMIWRGTNAFNSPGQVGLISYKIKINNPGTYRFIWRNVIGIIDPANPSSEHNDSWLKFSDASDFWAQKGNSKLWPKGSGKSPTPEGGGGNGYFKIFANSLQWNWKAATNDNNGHNIYVKFNSAGVYTMLVSGRSTGHAIDRMVLYKENQYSASQAESLSRAQTLCGGGGTPPPPPPPPPPGENNAPTVSITNPDNGQNFSAGSTVTVNVSSNDTDGSITKHEVFVNNTKVDTDGSNYTPHKITNITQGSYAIKVTVTDNDGATASSTVNITVGSGNPPPPPPPGENAAPTVSITSPNNGQNFNVGSTVTVNVSANDTDGSVTKYQIYVNNKLVDTDGSNFTPHKITNIANGNYAIRATVTDNEGATTSATVNITVGNNNPPPPSGNDISLTLVNATTDNDNGPLVNGTNVSSSSNINVRADVANGNVKSVFFQLRGATFRNQTENVSPFALFGDDSGNYKSGSFNNGSHTLTVEAYSGLNRSGSLLESYEVSFTVASGGKSAIAYPNPVKQGDVTIKLPEEINGEAGYAIISPSGIEIERGTINTNSLADGKTLQIDSSTMKNDGVYYLVIQANYDVFTVPIIKQ